MAKTKYLIKVKKKYCGMVLDVCWFSWNFHVEELIGDLSTAVSALVRVNLISAVCTKTAY